MEEQTFPQLNLMAKQAFESRDFVLARTLLHKALDVATNKSEKVKALNSLARVCFTIRDISGALDASQRTVRLEPSEENFLQLSMLQSKQGDLAMSKATATSCVERLGRENAREVSKHLQFLGKVDQAMRVKDAIETNKDVISVLLTDVYQAAKYPDVYDTIRNKWTRNRISQPFWTKGMLMVQQKTKKGLRFCARLNHESGLGRCPSPKCTYTHHCFLCGSMDHGMHWKERDGYLCPIMANFDRGSSEMSRLGMSVEQLWKDLHDLHQNRAIRVGSENKLTFDRKISDAAETAKNFRQSQVAGQSDVVHQYSVPLPASISSAAASSASASSAAASSAAASSTYPSVSLDSRATIDANAPHRELVLTRVASTASFSSATPTPPPAPAPAPAPTPTPTPAPALAAVKEKKKKFLKEEFDNGVLDYTLHATALIAENISANSKVYRNATFTHDFCSVPVIIKIFVLPESEPSKSKVSNDFNREVRRLQDVGCKSEFVVNIIASKSAIEIGPLCTVALIVMENYELGDLRSWMYDTNKSWAPPQNLNDIRTGAIGTDNRPFPVISDLRNVVFQLVRALQDCHNHNVVHLDIKPENIVLTQDCDTNRLLIRMCDFAFSRKLSQDKSATKRPGEPLASYTGTIGTEQCWVAPEVLRCKDEKKPYEKNCDIWALGMLLYFVATGACLIASPAEAYQIEVSNDSLLQKLQQHGLNEDHPLLFDLISKMIVPSDQRISLDQAATHPFLWTVSKTCNFIITLGDFLNNNKSAHGLGLRQQLRLRSVVVIPSRDWFNKLPRNLQHFAENSHGDLWKEIANSDHHKHRQHPDRLLIFFRNALTHYKSASERFVMIGTMKSTLVHSFGKSFPNLNVALYEACIEAGIGKWTSSGNDVSSIMFELDD